MSDWCIVAVDDEEELLLNMKDYFSDYNLEIFSDPQKAVLYLKDNPCSIIISDYKMPKITGLELLKEIKKSNSYSYAILYTAFSEKSMLEEMINTGLINKVLEKPLMFRELKKVIDEAIQDCKEMEERQEEYKAIKNGYESHKLEFNESVSNIIGINKGLKDIYEKLLSIAKHPINILLTGETGTGKELIAKAIHSLSPRKEYPFIKINTTAIPDTLFESELFGYKKGAFSNAVSDKAGKIELANKGTLFLDEIGDMNINLQAKLLRVLQEKELERLGSNTTIKVDFRLIAATNKNLLEAIKKGEFREDLYYRINDFSINLPPLRNRIDDMEELVNFFVSKFSKDLGFSGITISKDAIFTLKQYSWPGNIRELENAIKRVVITSFERKKIEPTSFNFLFPTLSEKSVTLDDALEILKENVIKHNIDLETIEQLVVKKILKFFDDSVSDAVEKTGISKNKFYKVKE